MKTINNLFVIIFGSALVSCGNQHNVHSKSESNLSNTIKTITINDFYVEESEITSNDWKEYNSDTSASKSSMQIELDNSLKNESIDNYFKEIYQKEKLISADDNKMLSITDSLFTKNPENDLFYFIVFTKSMNGSDGFYSEALGLSAFSFVTNKTEWFSDYFNTAPKLTDKDMNNWANYVYGEILISREGEELKAINELEIIVLENIIEARKDHRAVIEKFIGKIRKAHNNS